MFENHLLTVLVLASVLKGVTSCVTLTSRAPKWTDETTHRNNINTALLKGPWS